MTTKTQIFTKCLWYVRNLVFLFPSYLEIPFSPLRVNLILLFLCRESVFCFTVKSSVSLYSDVCNTSLGYVQVWISFHTFFSQHDTPVS